ncbi:hypothetical protein FEM48_Zijuj01G0155500 [Ziziphus jujuba var. spinosa]|uniref:Pentatricopeptide repeat-containing protein n=1 Tax=Ziziphus jujuba var. spinosa TaxID=714518 RepID=A0A978W226_ZIZJJ|nr:hypothetical protein FEM48_Zijuj01G0155500 [Ziziphus jujuba var. spinosa]
MEAKQLEQEITESPLHSPAYQALLRAGPRLRPLEQVHAHLVVSGSHRSRALLTKLLTLACIAGSIVYARRLLFSVPSPDSFLFNSLFKASLTSGFPLDTVSFYHRMLRSGIWPSTYTFTSVIKACADLSTLKLGRSNWTSRSFLSSFRYIYERHPYQDGGLDIRKLIV